MHSETIVQPETSSVPLSFDMDDSEWSRLTTLVRGSVFSGNQLFCQKFGNWKMSFSYIIVLPCMWWMVPLNISWWVCGGMGEVGEPFLLLSDCFRELPFSPISLPPTLTSNASLLMVGELKLLLFLESCAPFLEIFEWAVSRAELVMSLTNVQRGHSPKKSSTCWDRSLQVSQSTLHCRWQRNFGPYAYLFS